MPNKYIEMYNYMLNFLKFQNSYNLIGKNYKIIDFHMLNNLIHLNNNFIQSSFNRNFIDKFKNYFK